MKVTLKLEIESAELESDITSFINELSNRKGIKVKIDEENKKTIDQTIDDDMNDIIVLTNLQNDFKGLSLKALSKLSFSLFERFPEKFDWTRISYLDLKEDFVERNFDRLNKYCVSTMDLSEEFIMKNHKDLNISVLISSERLPDELKEEYEKEIKEYEMKKMASIYDSEIAWRRMASTQEELDKAKADIRNAGIDLIINSSK